MSNSGNTDVYSTEIEIGDVVVTSFGDRYVVEDIVPVYSTYGNESAVKGFYIDSNDKIDTSILLDLGTVDSTTYRPCGLGWGAVSRIDKKLPMNVNVGTFLKKASVGQINVTNITLDVKPPSKECPCGIFRADCTYHK